MSGSIMPKMVFPLLLVGGWATCITCVSALTQKNRAAIPLPHTSYACAQRTGA
jgi:hypothetical protein